jgi:hypothetical protein
MELFSSKDKPQILWHYKYWDYPLDGVALYKGDFVYFDYKEDKIITITEEEFDALSQENQDLYYFAENGYYYRCIHFYNFYRLCTEESDRLIKEHKEFEEIVGKHCNHYPGTYEPFKEHKYELPERMPPLLGEILVTLDEDKIEYLFRDKDGNGSIKL